MLKAIISVVILAILFLFINHFFPYSPKEEIVYLSLKEVEGVDVYHQGKAYPLNFTQQKEFVRAINKLKPINQNLSDSTRFEFEKIIVYRFNLLPFEIIPVSLKGPNLIFKIENWDLKNFFLDTTSGQLKALLKQSYDS